MLVDVEFALARRLDNARVFFEEGQKAGLFTGEKEADVLATFGFETVQTGVYYAGIDADRAFRDMVDMDMDYGANPAWTRRNSSGIADTPEQVLAYTKADTMQTPCVVLLTVIERAKQPKIGGWRWSKWGTYIGTRKRKADFLANEPEIDKVLVWRVVPLDREKWETAFRREQRRRELAFKIQNPT
jgi:hypothetical protein